MILHGLFGPALAPKNIATTLTWVHFRGALGFCSAICRKLLLPRMSVHARAKSRAQVLSPGAKLATLACATNGSRSSLLVAMLFVYEWLDLWASPWWTAWLIVAYFAGALLVDALFKHAAVLQIRLSHRPVQFHCFHCLTT